MKIQNSKFKIQNSNEKGIALVLVLILSTIALAMMAALIYMLTSGTQVSGGQKRYKTALEAGVGGSDIMYQVIASRIVNPATMQTEFNFLTNFNVPTAAACLEDKMLLATGAWDATCTADTKTMTIDPTDTDTYDFRFDTPAPVYRVYAKIVDTIPGNRGGDIGLSKGGATESAGAEVMSRPFFYTIEVLSQSVTNPNERAKLSILYEY